VSEVFGDRRFTFDQLTAFTSDNPFFCAHAPGSKRSIKKTSTPSPATQNTEGPPRPESYRPAFFCRKRKAPPWGPRGFRYRNGRLQGPGGRLTGRPSTYQRDGAAPVPRQRCRLAIRSSSRTYALSSDHRLAILSVGDLAGHGRCSRTTIGEVK
jgi:hypothetical protein